MDRYSARINMHGNTQRERMANRLRNHLNRKNPESLSYKDVKLNGVESHLVIDSGTQTYYKEYKSMPGQIINIGDYVEWANSYWIVYTCDSDDEFYRDGKLYQCNYLLKWQNDSGRIIERWAHIQSASKYNDGTTGNDVIMLGSDQLSVIMPLDKETLKLKKAMGKKFFIDNNKEDPTAYELTGTGNVPDTYNGHGVTSWIVKECAYTATKEDIRFGVCEYRKPRSPVSKNASGTAKLFAKIEGIPTLDIGFPRTYSVRFMDKEKCELNYTSFRWNVVSDFDIQKSVNEKQIELLVNDENCIGDSFLLQVINSNGSVLAEIKPMVVEGF